MFISERSWWRNLIVNLTEDEELKSVIRSQFRRREKKVNRAIPSTWVWSYWQDSLPFAVRKMWATSNQTQCPLFKNSSVKTCSALNFVWINLLNMAHSHLAFSFNGKPLWYVIVFVSPKSVIFLTFVKWLTSNRSSCTCFGSPNRKPYTKHLISLGFLVCIVSYRSSFFSSIDVCINIELWFS